MKRVTARKMGVLGRVTVCASVRDLYKTQNSGRALGFMNYDQELGFYTKLEQAITHKANTSFGESCK